MPLLPAAFRLCWLAARGLPSRVHADMRGDRGFTEMVCVPRSHVCIHETGRGILALALGSEAGLMKSWLFLQLRDGQVLLRAGAPQARAPGGTRGAQVGRQPPPALPAGHSGPVG